MQPDVLTQLQAWYEAQCDGHWEHSFGIKIDTLDNPGWSVEVDIVGTALEGKSFVPKPLEYHSADEAVGNDWMVCKLEEGKFKAFGGPHKLAEMLNAFLRWAAADGSSTSKPNQGVPPPNEA